MKTYNESKFCMHCSNVDVNRKILIPILSTLTKKLKFFQNGPAPAPGPAAEQKTEIFWEKLQIILNFTSGGPTEN